MATQDAERGTRHAPGAASPRYPRIEDHGIIGDLHSVALVAIDGTIDWYGYPHVDSPSVFGALLDADKGGRFALGASGGHVQKQIYLPDTNVLITRFLGHDGMGEVMDFMPVDQVADGARRHRIVRRATAVSGEVTFDVRCAPAFDYARAPHEVVPHADGALFHAAGIGRTLALAASVPVEVHGSEVGARFTLRDGERADFLLEGIEGRDEVPATLLDADEVERAFRSTVAWWRRWLAKSHYRGRWREQVMRSAMVLKLLTFQPTGAIVAAATTSLPEHIGGTRNWDYRFTWVRDASFTLYALLRIGFTEEAAAFMRWLQERAIQAGGGGHLQPLYSVEGRADLKETVLDHLEGYMGSRPVRVGNAASEQLQLDIYGELMDAVYLYNKYGTPIGYDLWVRLRRMLDWLCEHWDGRDQGIWEVRGPPKAFVFSRFMTWVALDRGIRLAQKRSFPADVERWRRVRDTVYEQVMEHGWSEERQAFVQAYGSTALDASALLMPLVFFVSPTDPRMLSTLDAIQADLAVDNMVYRYDLGETEDGLPGREGTFTMCSFWLVEALTRAGRLDEARLLFEKTLGYANHLGLYAEEIGRTGEALGNFPQAFTHISLISAAFNLDRALGGEGPRSVV